MKKYFKNFILTFLNEFNPEPLKYDPSAANRKSPACDKGLENYFLLTQKTQNEVLILLYEMEAAVPIV